MALILYIVALAIFGLAGLVFFFLQNKKNQVLKSKKAILLYLLFAILISAGGLVGYSPAIADSMSVFIGLQVVYFGLGALASAMYRKYAPPAEHGERLDWGGVAFILVNAFLGMIGFALVYSYFASASLAPYYSLCVAPFVIPHFLNVAFKSFQAIPDDIHKIWYYPVHADEVDFDNVDTSNIYMLELEYSKNVNDPRLTNTRLRAPAAMNFGEWFRSFVENYNYKFDSDPITFVNDDGTPQGWMFYVKPSLLRSPKYIDPDNSIIGNGITEKHVIVAKRVGVVVEDEAY